MKDKHEPCSICEGYIEGVVCDNDECPVAKMKTKIEKLYKSLNLTAREQYTNGRNDGIKEFAERLKEAFDVRTEPSDIYISTTDLDRLVKEMTEDQKNDPKEIH